MSRKRPRVEVRWPMSARDVSVSLADVGGVKGTPVRPRRRRRVETPRPKLCVRGTSVKARALRWRAEQEDRQSSESRGKEFYFPFPMFCGQQWLISVILNSQGAFFIDIVFRLVSCSYSECKGALPLGPRASPVRLESHTPAAPWAASSWIL